MEYSTQPPTHTEPSTHDYSDIKSTYGPQHRHKPCSFNVALGAFRGQVLVNHHQLVNAHAPISHCAASDNILLLRLL